MQTRARDWFNTITNKDRYGLQVKTVSGKWCNVTENGELMLFGTPEERDAQRAVFRKIKAPAV